ncbi:MAG TPA: hypothetical protein VGV39_04585 [Mesorhizobium sp.]|jgi:hypothetical protein|uniref:DUF6950 family protein n=1 Tax=Mesorhizobium sp. TaxID=1871066 RepID=UPI002DDD3C4B|nr:hypothetical protein [Mesorhizobium sp.]HEV2502325.1 hypothetical protein [Mesorhizobium sp.]
MTDLVRLPDWRLRFDAAIDEIRYVPFAWEDQHDCALGLPGRLVCAMTGEDLTTRYRGKYKSARGALGIVRRAGFDNLADMVGSILPEIHPSQATIGDLAAYEMDSAFGYALGVVNGERVFVLRPEGIGTMDLLDAKRAFKVG